MSSSNLLRKAYDPEQFRRDGYQLVDLLCTYLERSGKGLPPKVIDWRRPDEALGNWQKQVEHQDSKAAALFDSVLDYCVNLHHPHYMGHQISPPVPLAALAGMLGDFMNNGMGVYEMGMAGTAIERIMVKMVAATMGFGADAGGVLTSGGSLANLTALLAARSGKAQGNVWQNGAVQPLSLMVSEEAHYCVDRAVRIMGWGEKGIVKVPVDDQYRMKVDSLERSLQKARTEGREVIAVVGSACSTSTGSFDDLETIGRFCSKHGLWFHVDGAHGGALAFSAKYRHQLKGIEQADSVAMDFHKMLLTPAITTALIFRKETDSYRTFAQQARYLWDEAGEPEWFNLAKRTFECTKVMMGLKAFSILHQYGTELFDQYVTKVIDLSQHFARLIRQRSHLQLALQPQCNIVCFRFLPDDPERANDMNERIRNTLLEEGIFYIVKTSLKGNTWLRTTLSNPFTEESHLEKLLDEVERIGMSE